MAEISIERLHLSVRASNVLHRMGIHSVEKLQVTPMEKIAAQRNIGVKTLGEIQAALRDLDTLLKQPVASKRRSVRLEEDLQDEEEEKVSHEECPRDTRDHDEQEDEVLLDPLFHMP